VNFTEDKPHTLCPICGEESQLLETGLIDAPDNNYRLCTTCQLGFQEFLPSQQMLDEYYHKEYRERGHFSKANPQEYYEGKGANINIRWHYLHDYFGPGQAVLDVGCATGNFMEKLVEAGCTVNGLEPYHAHAEYARQFGIVKEGYIETVELPQKYDGICLFHVLEHLRNPLSILQKLRDSTTAGSRIFVEVPNIWDPLNAFAFPEEFKHFISPHLWAFSPKSLETVMREAGWIVTRKIPHQRTSFLSHLFHVFDNGKTHIGLQETQKPSHFTINIKCSPPMREILRQIDIKYRQMVTEKNMADTLLMIGVNPG